MAQSLDTYLSEFGEFPLVELRVSQVMNSNLDVGAEEERQQFNEQFYMALGTSVMVWASKSKRLTKDVRGAVPHMNIVFESDDRKLLSDARDQTESPISSRRRSFHEFRGSRRLTLSYGDLAAIELASSFQEFEEGSVVSKILLTIGGTAFGLLAGDIGLDGLEGQLNIAQQIERSKCSSSTELKVVYSDYLTELIFSFRDIEVPKDLRDAGLMVEREPQKNVCLLQVVLNQYAGKRLVVDGVFGPETFRAFQAYKLSKDQDFADLSDQRILTAISDEALADLSVLAAIFRFSFEG